MADVKDDVQVEDDPPEDEVVIDDVDEVDETDEDAGDGESDEDESDEVGGEERAAAGEKPRSRGEQQFSTLRADRRRLAQENADLTRRLSEIERRVNHPAPQETPAQRAERLALLSPEERIREEVSETLRRHEANQNQLNAQLLDQADKLAFDGNTSSMPLAKKLAPEVERRLADIRSRGQNLPRMAVFTYILGERVLAGKTSVKSQRTSERTAKGGRPPNSGGDVPQGRQRRTGDAVADFEARNGDALI